MNRPEVLALFASQHWVASTDQLRSLSVSSRTIERWCRSGTLTRLGTGVVQLTGSPDSFESRAMALQLVVGDGSFLSGVTAGALHGLRNMPRQPVQITVGHGRRVRLPSWGRLEITVWVNPERHAIVRPDGLRVATPLMTLFRLARTFNQHRFERAAEDCWHKQLLTPDDAAAFLAEFRASGRTGVRKFEKWLERCAFRTRPSHSGLELDVLETIRRAGLPEPERQFPLTLRSGETIHIDLAWPDVRLGIEPGHSWWHGGDLGQRADQARHRACDELGWRIVRHDESLRDELAAFGLQLRIIHDERRRSIRSA